MIAMHVFSADEMRAIDRATTEQNFFPSLDLMRNAAAAVAGFAREQFPLARRVTVLCRTGNNGGDGMMAARLLSEAGLKVITLLLGEPEQLKGDAAIAWSELTKPVHGRVQVVTEAQELAAHHDALAADLIVDAVLGTGFKPPLKDMALAAFEWLQKSQAPILAVDLPTGWPADETSATVSGAVFPADAVITACRVRLRPILMTSLATIIGMIPMALKMGIGAEQYTPMARAIIGGLTSSVILTIFIVPAAYLLVYGRRGPRNTETPPTESE